MCAGPLVYNVYRSTDPTAMLAKVARSSHEHKQYAEPCTGSNSAEPPGWMLPDAAVPSPPWSCAPRWVTMSPKVLQVTMTSNCS